MQSYMRTCALVLGVGSLVALSAVSEVDTMELDWDDPAIQMTRLGSTVTADTIDGRPVLRVDFDHVEWPHVMFRPVDGVWDWDDWEMLEVDVYNPTKESIRTSIRIDNEGAPAHLHRIAKADAANPDGWTTIRVPFDTGESPLWGMRGLPEAGSVPSGHLDPSRVTAFQVYLPRPSEPHTLYLGEMRLIRGDAFTAPIDLPFIDTFGQYKHADWPGKIHSIEELRRARDEEEAILASAPSLSSQDDMGGWRDGPQLEATGWFRTEIVDGKWWLVTPEGRLFLSFGMNCVSTRKPTFVEGREEWFDGLPPQDDLDFAPFYEIFGPVHSMADPIDGQGLAFGFYGTNLFRKYGNDWSARWQARAYDRLRAWGFNTIGAWSRQDVLEESPLPFTAIANATDGVPSLEAGQGYWSSMADVFDPEFPERAERSIAPTAQRYADDPLCVGFFIDNELAWGDIRAHTLSSPPDQPARQFFIAALQEKYGSIDQLNAAWGTSAECWDTLDRPASETRAARADLDDYVYAFSQRYFQTIRTILRRHAPNHLYLGCRFAGPPEESVFRACAENVDVISLNLYYITIDPEEWNLERTYGKPAMIGEFHFGALDRGMFHTGLQPAADQEDRAAKYADYVRSIATNPAFVGSHWFQYDDQPKTGRALDGENYNIGFVTGTDTPYPELVEAAFDIHNTAYAIRAAQE